jgi:hypothetical protein
MQAYHQSFNPQAYITNTNGAAAAVAAAAYYQHHNPANYVIPSQYSIGDNIRIPISETFGYNPNSTSSNAAFNSQQVRLNFY